MQNASIFFVCDLTFVKLKFPQNYWRIRNKISYSPIIRIRKARSRHNTKGVVRRGSLTKSNLTWNVESKQSEINEALMKLIYCEKFRVVVVYMTKLKSVFFIWFSYFETTHLDAKENVPPPHSELFISLPNLNSINLKNYICTINKKSLKVSLQIIKMKDSQFIQIGTVKKFSALH